MGLKLQVQWDAGNRKLAVVCNIRPIRSRQSKGHRNSDRQAPALTIAEVRSDPKRHLLAWEQSLHSAAINATGKLW